MRAESEPCRHPSGPWACSVTGPRKAQQPSLPHWWTGPARQALIAPSCSPARARSSALPSSVSNFPPHLEMPIIPPPPTCRLVVLHHSGSLAHLQDSFPLLVLPPAGHWVRCELCPGLHGYSYSVLAASPRAALPVSSLGVSAEGGPGSTRLPQGPASSPPTHLGLQVQCRL